MRAFHSYGPVKSHQHYYVPRTQLVNNCVQSLIGDPEDSGHFFTIWGPRQTGKTWLYRQSMELIKQQYKDQFIVGEISMQSIAFLKNDDPVDTFFENIPGMFRSGLSIQTDKCHSWTNWKELFGKDIGIFDRPLILIIDEFDKLPKELINTLVSLFRDMYLNSKQYMLHGLALVGVRAVLGVESKSGSPFNIQRSLHIPNLSFDEVQSMFNQYQAESKQPIDPEVVQKLFEKTRGQPGLIGWFGELLTDTWKYNPGYDKTIDINMWKFVYERACNAENNNTVMNIISKAKNDYADHVLQLFSQSDIQFSLDTLWCSYMYMHGIIDNKTILKDSGEYKTICCFSSPFIQHKIYNAFIYEIKTDYSVPILDYSDDLSDIFLENKIDIPALIKRYTNYLSRLYESGMNPWKNQPRRKSDFHLTEAVGHFHLYHWLQTVLGERCAVIPEFPTGNGKVDIHIKCNNLSGLIEVKSFKTAYDSNDAIHQAAKYSTQTNHEEITVAMFTPFLDNDVLEKLSVEKVIDNVKVTVVAIGQG